MASIRLSAVLLLTLAVGCEHKNKNSEPKPPDDKGGMQPSGDPSPAARAKDNVPPADKGGGGACDQNVRPPTAADLPEYMKGVQGEGKLVATIDTSMGTIHCELFPDKAPMTVANFIGLAMGKKAWTDPNSSQVSCKPFYDGLTFHRVIAGFMIQGGDPMGVGRGGPGYQFGDEFAPDLKMQAGALAMANAGPGTNGSQFFITDGAPDWLNGKHTIFGQCKEVDLVKQIEAVPQDAQNKPNTPVTMKKVTISKLASW